MRILMISDFYPPFVGGVEVLVSTLSRALVDRGHDVIVTTLAADDLPATELDDRVRVHRIRSTAQRSPLLFANESRPWAPPAPDPEAVAAMRSVVGSERPEIVHGHDWLARSYLPLKRRRGPALVMSLHYFTLSCPKKSLLYDGSPCSGPALAKCLGCAGRHYGRGKGAAVVLAQRTFSRAERALVDLFLPVSEDTARGNGLPGSGLPYIVMPNLVPPAGEAAAHEDLLAQLPDEPFLLFVGDVRPAKGIHVLLDAYSRLATRPPLVLIGKVWADSPRELPPGVLLLRNWPNAAVRAAMGRALALVTPSLWREPFGIVVAEALAAGRPVVASAIGGIPEIVRDGVEGLLVPPGDIGLLTAALERIVRDDGLREALAAGARRRSEQYLPDAVVPRVEAAYERAVSGRVYSTLTPRRSAARA